MILRRHDKASKLSSVHTVWFNPDVLRCAMKAEGDKPEEFSSLVVDLGSLQAQAVRDEGIAPPEPLENKFIDRSDSDTDIDEYGGNGANLNFGQEDGNHAGSDVMPDERHELANMGVAPIPQIPGSRSRIYRQIPNEMDPPPSRPSPTIPPAAQPEAREPPRQLRPEPKPPLVKPFILPNVNMDLVPGIGRLLVTQDRAMPTTGSSPDYFDRSVFWLATVTLFCFGILVAFFVSSKVSRYRISKGKEDERLLLKDRQRKLRDKTKRRARRDDREGFYGLSGYMAA